MTKKELCEKVFQDLFNGNYEKGKAIVLLQKHLGAKNLEETQKNLQNQFNDREFTDKILQRFSQKSIMSFTYNGLILCTNTSKKQKRNRELFFSVFFYV